jgi:hypothetical protein
MPQPRRIHRAPADSGGRLLDPPLSSSAGHASIEDLVDNNRLLRAAFDTRIGDLKLWELVAATRREMLTVAVEYTAAYRDASRPDDVADWIARPIVMGGHQPELFHPGVWLKNAALDAYARRLGGTAINLVVDSDRCQGTTAPVPVGTPLAARLEHVPFDAAAPEMPWEERGIVDRDCFESFGHRAADLLTPLSPHCMLRPWWPLVVERAHESHRLGLGIAQARHMLEARFGLESLELPVSEMVRLPTVMVFIGWLLAHTPRFHEAHNAAVAAYRREHRVRGRGRPIPELAARREAGEEWLEVPWWLWAKDDPRRRRVFASRSPEGLTLSDLETVRIELPISPETTPSKWVDALSRIEEHQLRLRPRAVVTTLIARLLVSDVFVHGIGGAAYDRITDDLVRRLTGCDPPRHAVVSGTLRLPVEQLFPGFDSADPEAKLAAVQAGLRDLEFHPERHLEPLAAQPEAVQELVTEKWRWIKTHPTTALARRRCREIRAANARLAVHTGPLRDDMLGRVGPLAAAIRGRKTLMSREFPWCFFPEKTLKTFLTLETV